MKKYLLPAIKLTLLSIILLSGIYTLISLGIAQAMPDNGKGQKIIQNNKIYYINIGQSFTNDKYFWSRPSAVAYDAAGSGGSNKGPTNPEYLQTVQARIDTFIVHNPGIEKSEIPEDLITASGSGLDPNTSIKTARVQAMRISKIRNIPEKEIQQLIDRNIEKPLLGLFGPYKINVLKLNLALDNLDQSL